jgi:hypothetical protein
MVRLLTHADGTPIGNHTIETISHSKPKNAPLLPDRRITADVRVHRTMGETPMLLWSQQRRVLLPQFQITFMGRVDEQVCFFDQLVNGVLIKSRVGSLVADE